jgi:flagellar hook-length control protein FliK
MTSTPIVTNSAASQTGNASMKARATTRDEEELSALPEFFAFADLFSQVAADPPPPPAGGDSGAKTAEPAPPSEVGVEVEAEFSALQMAATHSAWFGEQAATPASEPLVPRVSGLIIRQADSAMLRQTQTGATSIPNLLGVDGSASVPVPAIPQRGGEVSQVAAQLAAATRDSATPNDTAATSQVEALRFAAAMLRGADRGAVDQRPAPNPAVKGRAAATGEANPPTASGQGPTAKVQASLSALQAVLSGGGSNPDTISEPASGLADQARDAIRDTIKEAGISSIRQETHFAPASHTPLQQIAQRITQEMQSSGRGVDPTANPLLDAKMPLRVLHLQLDPPQLGPMTIRISMQHEALRIQLETSNYDTARLIHNDREGLSRMLRAAGYAVDGLNVQVTPADRGSAGQQPGPNYSPSHTPDQQPGWRQPQPQSDGRQSDRGWRNDAQPQEGPGRGQDRGPAQSQTGRTRGVYL